MILLCCVIVSEDNLKNQRHLCVVVGWLWALCKYNTETLTVDSLQFASKTHTEAWCNHPASVKEFKAGTQRWSQPCGRTFQQPLPQSRPCGRESRAYWAADGSLDGGGGWRGGGGGGSPDDLYHTRTMMTFRTRWWWHRLQRVICHL